MKFSRRNSCIMYAALRVKEVYTRLGVFRERRLRTISSFTSFALHNRIFFQYISSSISAIIKFSLPCIYHIIPPSSPPNFLTILKRSNKKRKQLLYHFTKFPCFENRPNKEKKTNRIEETMHRRRKGTQEGYSPEVVEPRPKSCSLGLESLSTG